MDIAMIFAVLGIHETKEEAQIRKAYYEKLSENNPEDHPEGFRRLREAYEQALAYANMPEENLKEKKEEDTSLLGCWMKRLSETYFCLPKRLCRKAWQELFQDEVCIDLDYAEEAKWKLFRFLAEHYRLNNDIYRLLDETFGILEGEKEFKEHLPAAFVDYMIRKIQDIEDKEDFPYQWMEGADTADYDQFQDRLYELEEFIRKEKYEEANQAVSVMESLGISHPYYQLAKLRLAVQNGEKEVAFLVRKLLEDYPESGKIQVLGAEVLWNCEEKEEAAKIFQNILETFGSYYIVEKYLALYEREKGNLSDAVLHCARALQKTEDEMLEGMLKELDLAFIAECKEKLETGNLEAEQMRQVCNSFIRTGCAQEGIALLLNYPDYLEKIRNIHNVLAVLYFHSGEYQKSIEECRLWREAIQSKIKVEEYSKEETLKAEEHSKEETSKTEDLKTEESVGLSQLALTYLYEGRVLKVLAEKKLIGKEVLAAYKRAEKAFLEAFSYGTASLEQKQDFLDLLILMAKYEQAILIADEMLAQNKEWFPALVQKQLAYYELDSAQEVVDLFYEAKRIYAKYPPIYELAAKVFIDYEQFENAENILKQAREEKLESFGLELEELHLERAQCKSKRSFAKLLKKTKGMLKRFQRESDKKRELAELYYHMAIIADCQSDFSSGKAKRYIEKAISLRINEPLRARAYYYYTYGRILQNMEQYEDAIKAYQIYRQNSEMSERLAMNLADCYREIGEWEKAVSFYQEALVISPKQREANRKIASIYRSEGVERESVLLLEKALPYANRQLEMFPNSAYDYRVRGNIYRLIGRLDLAMEDAEKSLKLEKNNAYGWMLKGRTLYYKGEYHSALQCFQKSIENLSNPKEYAHDMYSFAARCCWKMREYEEAERWYQRGIKLFEGKDQSDCYWKLNALYKDQGRYEEAFSLLNELYQKGMITEEEYISESIDERRGFCYSMEQILQLEQEAKDAAQKFDSIDAWETLGDIQFFYLHKKDSALAVKKMVMERVEWEQVQWENDNKYLERMHIYWERKETEEVEKWGRLFIQMIEAHYSIFSDQISPIKQYLKNPDSGYQNLCKMIRYWIFTGQMDLAKKKLEELKQMQMCRHCVEQECKDLFETLAIYYEAEGKLEKAYQYWNRNWKKNLWDEMYYYKTKTLGEKLGYPMKFPEKREEIWNHLNEMKIETKNRN